MEGGINYEIKDGIKNNSDESQEGSPSNPLNKRRNRPWLQEEVLMKKGTFSRQNSILVFNRSSNIPTTLASMYDDDDDGRSFNTFVGGIEDETHLVDKDDFVAMNEVMREWRALSRRNKSWDDNSPRFVTALHALKEFLRVDDENGSFKIIKVDLSRLMEESVGNRRDKRTNIRVVPPSIGKLTQLQELNLADTNILTVPSEILCGCKHLKVLNLSHTANLLQLSNAIMNLSALQELYLQNSGIRSLPHHSILTKLKSLEVLDLSGTFRLETMRNDGLPGSAPTENSLVRLRKLSLRHSALLKISSPSSLPPLWDSLIKPIFLSSDALVDLDLGGAKHIKNLEDVVPQKSKLERLDLSCTDITALPHESSAVYDKLVRLKVLSLTSTPVLRKYHHSHHHHHHQQKASETILSHLGCIGLRVYQAEGFASHRKLRHALAQNRLNFRVASLWHNKNGSKEINNSSSSSSSCRHNRFSVALWPVLLSTRAAFKPYEECNDKTCDCQRLIGEGDALFQTLVTFSNEIFGQDRLKLK